MAEQLLHKSNPILGRGNYRAKVGHEGKQQKFKLVDGMMIDSSLPQQPTHLVTRPDKRDVERFTTSARDIGSFPKKEESKFAPANVNKVHSLSRLDMMTVDRIVMCTGSSVLCIF
jgi:hypothetical protein